MRREGGKWERGKEEERRGGENTLGWVTYFLRRSEKGGREVGKRERGGEEGWREHAWLLLLTLYKLARHVSHSNSKGSVRSEVM